MTPLMRAPSALLAVGSFSGGKLEYCPDGNKKGVGEPELRKSYPPVVLDARASTVIFDGRRAHAVTPFEGERYIMVFFTSGDWEKADEDPMRTAEVAWF